MLVRADARVAPSIDFNFVLYIILYNKKKISSPKITQINSNLLLILKKYGSFFKLQSTNDLNLNNKYNAGPQ